MHVILFAALFLAGCNLGVVTVVPETRECYDTTITAGLKQNTLQIDTLECETGKLRERWVWE